MYVIGEVESNWTWNSVYYADPITLGMWQFYGVEGAQHLHAMRAETPDDYARLTANLRSIVESHPADDGWWNSYNLDQTDGNSWKTVAADSVDNHRLQQRQIEAKLLTDIETLQRWGMPTGNGREMVFMLTVYHQRPVSAQNILRSAGATADLVKLRDTTLNDRVLSRYKNRYNTAYARCAAWDESSAPPDYGQLTDVETGGDSPTLGVERSAARYIIQQGDNLVLYGGQGSPYEKGLVFYAAGAQRWVPSRNATGTAIGGGNTDDGSWAGSEAADKIVELMRSWENRFRYSQGADRLQPEITGAGDCSSVVWRAYQLVTGMDVGTWTGEQRERGTLIAQGGPGDVFPVSSARPADLLLVVHRNGVHHVEMYMGNNQLMGHGSAPGPHYNALSAVDYCATQSSWMLRRYL